MNKECEIVRDLLPLFAENMCSQTSVGFVRGHIVQCPGCQALLEDIQKPTPTIPDTNGEPLRFVRTKLRKRTVLSVITAVLLVLTLLAGIVVYATVPVWLSVDEAVVYAEQQADGSIEVRLTDRVCHITYLDNNRFCCQGIRADWLLREMREKILNQGFFIAARGENAISFKTESGQALWYCGQYASEADAVLWGTANVSIENSYYRQMDRSLLYILWVSAFVGCVLLVCGIILRKKRLGKWLLAVAALFICCALSTVFVTGGHLYDTAIRSIAMLKYSNLVKRYIAIAAMTIVSFVTVISSSFAICAYRDS